MSKDAELIHACMAYAQAISAASAAYEADPDGNCKHAERIVSKRFRDAKKSLRVIASLRARTAAGIAAKARIVPVVIDDDAGSSEPASIAFYRSFAADVKQYMEAVLHQEWLSQKGAA